MPCHAMTWHDMTCHDMTWHDMTCHGMALHCITLHYSAYIQYICTLFHYNIIIYVFILYLYITVTVYLIWLISDFDAASLCTSFFHPLVWKKMVISAGLWTFREGTCAAWSRAWDSWRALGKRTGYVRSGKLIFSFSEMNQGISDTHRIPIDILQIEWSMQVHAV